MEDVRKLAFASCFSELFLSRTRHVWVLFKCKCFSLQLSAALKIYYGRWLLWIMVCGVQCFLNLYMSASADVCRTEFHKCSAVPDTGCRIGHTGLPLTWYHPTVPCLGRENCYFYPHSLGNAREVAKSKPELPNAGLGRGWVSDWAWGLFQGWVMAVKIWWHKRILGQGDWLQRLAGQHGSTKPSIGW